MKLVTSQTLSGTTIEEGELVHACAISGANIVRDMREAITNTLGGHMTRYEFVLDQTIERALKALAAKAAKRGYDGVLGVRISHPMIVQGAIEVVVAGTGYYNVPKPDGAAQTAYRAPGERHPADKFPTDQE